MKLVAEPARVWLALQRDRRVDARVQALEAASAELPAYAPDIEPALDLARRLDRLPADLWGEAVAADFARVRTLGRLALDASPTTDQAYEFAYRTRTVFRRLRDDRDRSQARYVDLLRVAQGAR